LFDFADSIPQGIHLDIHRPGDASLGMLQGGSDIKPGRGVAIGYQLLQFRAAADAPPATPPTITSFIRLSLSLFHATVSQSQQPGLRRFQGIEAISSPSMHESESPA